MDKKEKKDKKDKKDKKNKKDKKDKKDKKNNNKCIRCLKRDKDYKDLCLNCYEIKKVDKNLVSDKTLVTRYTGLVGYIGFGLTGEAGKEPFAGCGIIKKPYEEYESDYEDSCDKYDISSDDE
jgi:hypothetical protein